MLLSLLTFLTHILFPIFVLPLPFAAFLVFFLFLMFVCLPSSFSFVFFKNFAFVSRKDGGGFRLDPTCVQNCAAFLTYTNRIELFRGLRQGYAILRLLACFAFCILIPREFEFKI